MSSGSTLWVGALTVFAIVTGACTATQPDGPVALRTEPRPLVCPAARIGGILVADPSFGLGFAGNGYEYGVVWPDGYSARREHGVVVLLDAAGDVVAREGDRMVAGGTETDDGVGHPCFGIQVEPSPS
jgi:hypothetical protein